MIPSRTMLTLAGLLVCLALLAAFEPSLHSAWLICLIVIAVIAFIDAMLALMSAKPDLIRKAPASLSLATWTPIEITVSNDLSTRPRTLRVIDHLPQDFLIEDLPREIRVEGGRYASFEYRVRATRRGLFEFDKLEARIASPARLWWRRVFAPAKAEVRVYPNYATISKLLAYEVSSNLSLAGLRLRRRRGEGTEFHQLRDYREGDSMRAIDWKATARLKRPIAREYQDERDQQIVFMLDTGRRMLAKDAELSHFDQALNAMFLLSYVALRQGDAAGVMTMGSSRSWLPPKKGMSTVNGLLNHVYDVQPQLEEIDYIRAATEFTVLQRRRSLVILLTNVREEDTEDLKIAIDLLGRRHLVMLASLRERVLDDVVNEDVHSFDDALTYASTLSYLESRREAQDSLRAMGVMVEDCLSDELPSAITNRYLAIKRAGIL